MRKLAVLALVSAFSLPALAQRGPERTPGGGGDRGPGGFGGGGDRMRGGMNPDESFNRLIQSYGGSGDVVDYSRVPPDYRARVDGFTTRMGGEPMPTSGTITRAQYAEVFNKRMEAMRNGGGFNRGGPGGFGGNTPGASPQQPMTMTVRVGGDANAPGQPQAMTIQPSGMQPMERQVSDEQLQKRFMDLDRDRDGRINEKEAQESRWLRSSFANYDKNRDGVIDPAEYKTYAIDRENNRIPEPGKDNNNGGGGFTGGGGNFNPPPNNNWSSSGGDWNRGNNNNSVTPAEEERPVALRYGKLPLKDLPKWWDDIDHDKDGQVGMYEWREARKAMPEFLSMDLNSDGYVTAEEYLRFKKLPAPVVSTDSKSDASKGSYYGGSRNNGGDKNNSGSNYQPRGNDKGNGNDQQKGKGKEERKGGNPFRDR